MDRNMLWATFSKVKKIILLLLALATCGEEISEIRCAVEAWSNTRKYFIVNNHSCNVPVGTSSVQVTDRLQRVFVAIDNPVTLFRFLKGSGAAPAIFYLTSTDFSKLVSDLGTEKTTNFKSSLLEEWGSVRPILINVTLQDQTYLTVAWLAFQVGSADSLWSWFNVTKLVSCYPWQMSTVTKQKYNFFTIQGDNGKDWARQFFISCRYGGCDQDNFMLVAFVTPDFCDYNWGLSTDFAVPRIFYMVNNGGCGKPISSMIEVASLEFRATYDRSIVIMT